MFHLTTQLPSTVEAPSAARAALADVLTPSTEPALDLAQVDETARLLLTELVSNSVRHASVPAESPVRIDIALDPICLRIEVYDEGSVAPEDGPSGPMDGFGLALVERLSDRWGIDHDDLGTRAWFELSLADTSTGSS